MNNKDKFIEQANIKFNNKFDYSLVEYKNTSTKVKIICPIHGEFESTPYSHLHSKNGCKKCSNISLSNSKKKSINDFIEEANDIHNSKYNYSKSIYTGALNKLTIICPIHGEFEQTPNDHISNKSGCPKCSNNIQLTNDDFIIQANDVHDFKYDYSLVEYKNMDSKVKIICPIHGEFEQTPASHIYQQSGCQSCGIERVKEKLRGDNKYFIEKANKKHNNKFDYTQTKYINSTSKLKIICPIHGEFWATPNSHLYNDYGCPSCAPNIGFDTTKKGRIYLLKYKYDDVWKIGITNNNVNKRYSKNELSNFDIIFESEYYDGIDIINNETEILRKYNKYKYTGDDLLLSGNTELLTKNPFDNIIYK